ncbi:uncharacterized protein LOC135471665 isoform X2 [Liolophura sinensis]
MKNTTAEEEIGSPQVKHTYQTLLKPFPEFNGVPPNKAVGTDVVCVEDFKAFSDICKNRRPSTTADMTRYFMQMPGVIVVGILINPLFGLLSFLTHVLLAKRAKQTEKARQWRRIATRLYFTGVVITVGIWAVVLAYNYGLYSQNVARAQEEMKKGNGKIPTNIHLTVLTSPSPVKISFYSQTEEAKTTTATTTSSTGPPELRHNKKATFDEFQLEISPFASDQSVKGIDDTDNSDGTFPFRK